MGLRIATAAAFSAGILGLSACGGSDSEAPEVEAAQSQAPAETPAPEAAPETAAEPETEAAPETAAETAAEPSTEAAAGDSPFADALLTEDEFPLDGFTRGEVVAETGGNDAPDDEAAGALDDLTAGQDLSPECEEALQFTDVGEGNVGDGSSADFTGATSSAGLPTSVSIAVAPLEGDSPLEALSKVSSECDSFAIEEEGQSMTMSFDSLDELEGTKISVESAGFEFGFIIGGESNDDVVVLAFGVGVDEADVAKVVDAQLEKVNSAG